MLFRRKYVFETKHTRTIRNLLNSLIGVILLCTLYSLVAFSFVVVADNESKQAAAALYQRPPDLIVVFTGDSGRLAYAIRKAKEFGQSHLLITGVYSGNTVSNLISTDLGLESIKNLDKIDVNHMELDYLAKNTIENVIETIRYVHENKDMNRILIISHDYHILRIKTLIERIKHPSEKAQFFYMGVKAEYNNWRNIKILYKEVFKIIRNLVMLFLWD